MQNDVIRKKERLITIMQRRLPILRETIAMSQVELTEYIGISARTYALLEKNRQKMGWNVFLDCFLFFWSNQETKDLLSFNGGITLEDVQNILKYPVGNEMNAKCTMQIGYERILEIEKQKKQK